MKAQLCRCNNCDTIMFDMNPDGQPELEAPENTKDMERCTDDDGDFWGCPVCGTDGDLIDLFEQP